MSARNLIFAGIAIALAACQPGGTTGGSETTNGLTGRIRYGDGRPAAGVPVALVPEDYDPAHGAGDAPDRAVTDAEGRYRFADPKPGGYALEAKDSAHGLKVLVPDLRVSDSGSNAGDAALLPTGTLVIPFGDRHLPENARLYVPGTTWLVSQTGRIDGSGNLVLNCLAAGGYKSLLAYLPDHPQDAPIPVAADFAILPGDSTRLDPYAAWAHRRAMAYAPGSDAGAKAAAVLVRLRAPAFDFSQAAADGADFRCLGPDGASLPYEIERWDAAAGAAEIWVRADGLRAGSDSVMLLWGRPDARAVSAGARVFDTASGLRAVWHLGGDLRDATASGSDAKAVGNAPVTSEGIAGPARSFAPAGGGLDAALPPGFGGARPFTVMFWTRFAPSAQREALLDFGGQTVGKGIHFLIRPDTTAQFGPFDTTPDAEPSPQQNHFPLARRAGEWIQVATAYDPAAGTLRTWIDGEPASESEYAGLDLQADAGLRLGRPLFNGTRAAEAGLDGALDEVRLYDRALGEAEIRLEHALQRPEAAAGVR